MLCIDGKVANVERATCTLLIVEFGHNTVSLVARRPPPTRRPETLSGNQAITTILSRDVIHSITQVSLTMDPLYLFLKTPEDAGANFCIDQLVVKTMAQPAAANIRRLDNTAGTVRATTLRPSAFSLVSSSLSTYLYQYLIFDCITLLD